MKKAGLGRGFRVGWDVRGLGDFGPSSPHV